MNIEEKVKLNLLSRGFDKERQLNSRGLIGATIDETILEVVKNLNIPVVVGQSEQLKCDCGETEDIKLIAICSSCYNPHTGEW